MAGGDRDFLPLAFGRKSCRGYKEISTRGRTLSAGRELTIEVPGRALS
ncbi:hypothetical protein GW871_03910 [bacterium]|nr:hypothetical protein [bacterium]